MPLLSTYIDRFSHIKTLVIGDIMLDRFIYGQVNRISPEAPVPVFRFTRERQMLGGAGNVVANLAALKCQTTFIGVVGRDENGTKIAALLKQAGAHAHLLKLPAYPTIVKTRLIAGNNHLARVDQEESLPLITDLLPKFRRVLNQAIKAADIVLLSDYNKGVLTDITTPMIIDICNALHKKVIVDPKGSNYAKYRGATLVKPNLKEFSEATGRTYTPQSPNFHADVISGAQRLFHDYRIENLIVTLSEHGMMHVAADQADDLTHIPTDAKEVFDVSGAGDTSLATLGAALGADTPVKDAMKLANLASGLVVAKLGTATVTAAELKNALSLKEADDHGWTQKRKIITLDQARALVAALKERGKKIGFTNGCFDCCHLGHLTSFMRTKKLCDVLIVAVNSDASVKRYKGPDRPIQDEKTRALLLASLEFIDYVIVFEEDSPLHIVDTLRPDIVAKEGYTLDKWPEGRLAISYGGQAVTLDRVDGYSTSTLVKKMKG